MAPRGPRPSPLSSPWGSVPCSGEVRHDGLRSKTELFGTAADQSAPLSLNGLHFSWPLHARTDGTVPEILLRTELPPDLARVRKIGEAGLVEQASAALARLMAEGADAGYQVPDEIRCDRTFSYSIANADYVERMASAILHPGGGGSSEFVLATVARLYVCPRPYVFSKALAVLQKSASALMRIHSIAVAHIDWSAYRRTDDKDGRVFRSACFEHGLSPVDFPAVPAMVRASFPSLGVHPLLPYVLKYFGYAFAEEGHPAHLTLVSNCEREWAWSVCNAVSTELGVNGRVFVQSAATLEFLGTMTPKLPRVSLTPPTRVPRKSCGRMPPS